MTTMISFYCPICHIDEEVLEETTSLLPCVHRFCTTCIQDWFAHGKLSCPLCKRDYNEDELEGKLLLSSQSRTRSHLLELIEQIRSGPLGEFLGQQRRIGMTEALWDEDLNAFREVSLVSPPPGLTRTPVVYTDDSIIIWNEERDNEHSVFIRDSTGEITSRIGNEERRWVLDDLLTRGISDDDDLPELAPAAALSREESDELLYFHTHQRYGMHYCVEGDDDDSDEFLEDSILLRDLEIN